MGPSHLVVLNAGRGGEGAVPAPESTWQCLQTHLVVMTGSCAAHLGVAARAAAAQMAPYTNDRLTQVRSAVTASLGLI